MFVYTHFSVDELISPKDIDPIHRYVPGQDQRNVSMRYSNQVSINVTVSDCHLLSTDVCFQYNIGFKCSSVVNVYYPHVNMVEIKAFKSFWPMK